MTTQIEIDEAEKVMHKAYKTWVVASPPMAKSKWDIYKEADHKYEELKIKL